jgi:hypothetical protein
MGLSDSHPSPACPSRASGWWSHATTWMGLPCCVCPPCRHAVATTPVDPRNLGCSALFSPRRGGFGFRGGGLPPCTTGSASTSFVSRLAQRSLALRPACSLSRLCDPLASEASADSLPPQLFRLLPGGTTQLPGRVSPPLEDSAFARRTVRDSLCGHGIGGSIVPVPAPPAVLREPQGS